MSTAESFLKHVTLVGEQHFLVRSSTIVNSGFPVKVETITSFTCAQASTSATYKSISVVEIEYDHNQTGVS